MTTQFGQTKRVIIAAEKAMWSFIFNKFPDIKNSLDDRSVENIRTHLINEKPELKFNLTQFRKEVIKKLPWKLGSMKVHQSTTAMRDLMNFLRLEIKYIYIKMQELFLSV